MVRDCQAQLAAGRLMLPSEVLATIRDTLGVTTASIDDSTALATIRGVKERAGYVLDPHSAIAVAAAKKCIAAAVQRQQAFASSSASASAMICMASAHPVKFAGAVALAFGQKEATALRDMPDVNSHPCVRRVATLAAEALAASQQQKKSTLQQQQPTTTTSPPPTTATLPAGGSSSTEAAPTPPAVAKKVPLLPRGCCAVLRRSHRSDWTRQLRAIIESLPPTAGSTHGSSARPKVVSGNPAATVTARL